MKQKPVPVNLIPKSDKNFALRINTCIKRQGRHTEYVDYHAIAENRIFNNLLLTFYP